MNTTLLDSVKNQLIKRTDAGALNTSELIHILEIESRNLVPVTQCNSVPTEPKAPSVEKEPVHQPEQTAAENVVSIETEKSEEQEAPEEVKELTPTEKQKLEISEKIVELGGTPPEKGSLAKFKQALADIESSQDESEEEEEETSTEEESEDKEETQTEESESEEEEESDEDIDQFNDLMDEAQNLYDELEEKEIVDMEQVVGIIQKIDSEANSPDELNLANLKKFVKKLKKFNK